METPFWHEKWERNEIAFHAGTTNPLLMKHLNDLSLVEGDRIFVPFCGKTLDIHWLLSRGYRVAGAELSKRAVEQLFAEMRIEPNISTAGELNCYSAPNIDIFVGNMFDLSGGMLGPVDAVYDRAALVALPEAMRKQYTVHLTEITSSAPQLLICYEYDQASMAGPPFSVSGEEVIRHYQGNYGLTCIASAEVSGGLKGKCKATENVWLLRHV